MYETYGTVWPFLHKLDTLVSPRNDKLPFPISNYPFSIDLETKMWAISGDRKETLGVSRIASVCSWFSMEMTILPIYSSVFEGEEKGICSKPFSRYSCRSLMTELVLKSLYLNWRHQQSRPTMKNTSSLPEVLQFWATVSEETNRVSQLRESTVAWRPRRSARPEPAKLPKGELQDRWQFNTQIYLETSLIPMVRSGAGARHRSGSCILRCGWALGLRSECWAEEDPETSSDSLQERLQKASKKPNKTTHWAPTEASYPGQGKDVLLLVHNLEGNFCNCELGSLNSST